MLLVYNFLKMVDFYSQNFEKANQQGMTDPSFNAGRSSVMKR